MIEEIQNQPAQETPAQETPKPAGDLNISDLLALRNIVDLASQRGAFKAGELESVGKVYNKLSAFLEAASKPQTETQ